MTTFLLSSLKSRLKQGITQVDQWLLHRVLPYIYHWPGVAALYYLANANFRREQRTVLAARIQHAAMQRRLHNITPIPPLHTQRDLVRHKDGIAGGINGNFGHPPISLSAQHATQALSELKRNLHRLEKGLIMRPRKAIFALDYIENTLQLLFTLTTYARTCLIERAELVTTQADATAVSTTPLVQLLTHLDYANQVISAYFAATTDWHLQQQEIAGLPHAFSQWQQLDFAALQNLRQRASVQGEQTVQGLVNHGMHASNINSVQVRTHESNRHTEDVNNISAMGKVPFPAAERVQSDVSYTDFYHLCQQRRSVRHFLPTPVPTPLLQQALYAAALAPSACNRQPYRFIFVNENPLLAKLAKLPLGTQGYHAHIPAILVVIGDLSAYPLERDRHVIYIDSSLAAMQAMLAMETLGLSSCAINWPDIDRYEIQIKSLLPLADYERVIMLMAVGYADPSAGIPHSEKYVKLDVLPGSHGQINN
jgi:nitroreductase